jgi:hypothetical protein
MKQFYRTKDVAFNVHREVTLQILNKLTDLILNNHESVDDSDNHGLI